MKLRTKLVLGVTAVAVVGGVLLFRGDSGEQKAAQETRQMLRRAGFKTELSEFDFSTGDEFRAREAALTNIDYSQPSRQPNLFQGVGKDCAIVVWRQAQFDDDSPAPPYPQLPSVEEALGDKEAELDRACAAALSGPIRFNLQAALGPAMVLPHLARLRALARDLGARAMLDLRNQRPEAAWTNLLALTRLTTAWQPEPLEISHTVRFALATTAFHGTWQALQFRGWSDAQLVILQKEWENAEFLKGLPDTMAFARATAVDLCVRERSEPLDAGMPMKETVQTVLNSPSYLWRGPQERMRRASYRAHGTYEDERALLLFYRDRELEMRRAAQAPAWSEMRHLPGVTNPPVFRSKYPSRLQIMLNTRQIARAAQQGGSSLAARAAETEARRRLLVTAIALERYRVAHGDYPSDLQALAPSFLKMVPTDFMDGQPLRYRREGGEFVLYSVGLDCVDNGGDMSPPSRMQEPFPHPAFENRTADLVWPRAATSAEVETFRDQVRQNRQKQELAAEARDQQEEQNRELRRQHIIAQLEVLYNQKSTPKIEDPKVNGQLLSKLLLNRATSADKALSLSEMLELRQTTAGQDSDEITFELPIRYDAVTNLGSLQLLVDADPADPSEDNGGQAQGFARGTNGNCLLVWNTMYDPPGKHFLQARLLIDNYRRSRFRRSDDDSSLDLRGPLFAHLSTNAFYFEPLPCVLTDKGAFFNAKLAQPVGDFAIEIKLPTGEHLHTLKGSTTNAAVHAEWNLIDDNGKRFTNETFQATWTVTFPEKRTTD